LKMLLLLLQALLHDALDAVMGSRLV
jgi:hypothetical protein